MRAAVLIVAALALGACDKDAKSSASEAAKGAPGATAAVAPPPVPAGATRITGEQYVVDVVTPDGCKAGAPCELRLQLHALGEFHVNREYPHKFVPAEGKLPAPRPGKLAISDDRTGTMTVAFDAPASGTAAIAGSFKLSVCSADNCVIEEPAITADVPVI